MTDLPPLTHVQLRAYIEGCGGPRDFAARHGLGWRNAERFYSGARPCPPRLADEIRSFMEAGA